MKSKLKRLVPERARLYLRRAGRLRWLTKARVLRAEGPGEWRGRPWRQLAYVLLDPEVDTFTYSPANTGELLERLARVLGRPPEELAGYLAEAESDRELGAAVAADIGWRVAFLKRRQRLPAHHLSAWIVIRATKPQLVVETGILEGLGSRTMLQALRRNGAEGQPGRLASFDVLPGAGEPLVPERLRGGWEPTYEPTPDSLRNHLEGREVGLYVHDSVPTGEHLRAELEQVLPRAAPGAVLMTATGWAGVLEELGAGLGVAVETLRERPRDHFYGGNVVSWLRLPTPGNG